MSVEQFPELSREELADFAGWSTLRKGRALRESGAVV